MTTGRSSIKARNNKGQGQWPWVLKKSPVPHRIYFLPLECVSFCNGEKTRSKEGFSLGPRKKVFKEALKNLVKNFLQNQAR